MLKSEIHVPVSRRNIAYGVVTILFSILVAKFYYLQIYQHEKYQELADFNRIRPVTIHAPRGQIFDRNGKVIATNRSVYTLSVIRDEMGDENREFDLIARYLGMTRQDIEANLNKYYRGRFLPAMVAREVPFDKLSLIEEHRNTLPGVLYSRFPVRRYPNSTEVNASHILGYLREISREELDRSESSDYNPGDFIGAQGIEKQYESRLRGLKGSLFQLVDALGRQVGSVKDRAPIFPIPGEDLHLTIDSDLQGFTEHLLLGKTGAVVVLNAKSGGVLTMVSKPDYPLEDFAGFIEEDTWMKYVNDESKPLFNRTILGLYPPGSAIKLISAIAALERGIVDLDWTVECSGEYHYGDRTFGCWREEGHGAVNLLDAIAQSCNVYFYRMIQKTDLDTWFHYAQLFGFGENSGIDLPEENRGITPNKAFMDEKYGKRKWSRGYLLNVVIGQGDVLVTPIQMARFIAVIATRGLFIQPRLLVEDNFSYEGDEAVKVSLKETTWDFIHNATFDVVNSTNGTAYSSRISDPRIAFHGKTGTAENPHGDPHAWFIGFARKGEETIALSLLLEHSGTGGSSAAPLASQIVQHYFGIPEEVVTSR